MSLVMRTYAHALSSQNFSGLLYVPATFEVRVALPILGMIADT